MRVRLEFARRQPTSRRVAAKFESDPHFPIAAKFESTSFPDPHFPDPHCPMLKWTDTRNRDRARRRASGRRPEDDPLHRLHRWVRAAGFFRRPGAQRREDPRGDPDGLDRRGGLNADSRSGPGRAHLHETGLTLSGPRTSASGNPVNERVSAPSRPQRRARTWRARAHRLCA